MIKAVVFDLDGVVRHHDHTGTIAIEAEHGLEPGAIAAAAFAEPRLTELVTGRLSRAEWLRLLGEQVGTAAVNAWGSQSVSTDPQVLRLADELRTAGLTTAILTNGTDETAAEVEQLGLGEHFDAIHNSADIGWAKPDRRVFQHVLDALGHAGPEVFFTDDSASKLAGAVELGMVTHHYTGASGLRRALRESGIPVSPGPSA